MQDCTHYGMDSDPQILLLHISLGQIMMTFFIGTFLSFISAEQPVRLSFLTPEQKICVVPNISSNYVAELNTSALWLPTPKSSQLLGELGSDSAAGHCGLGSLLVFLISTMALR